MAQATLLTENEIEERVMQQLTWDTRVDQINIKVAVNKATVVLTGTVPTYADKQLAEKDALMVPGVKSVDNRLKIRYIGLLVNPSDSDITANIKNALLWNSSLDASRISVIVNGGMVTLDGSVDSYDEKTKTDELTADVVGVLGITNKLEVIPEKSAMDDSILKDISSAFKRNKINTRSIRFKVNHGVVTISGSVADWSVYRAIEDIVHYTGGVTSVNNGLLIEQTLNGR